MELLEAVTEFLRKYLVYLVKREICGRFEYLVQREVSGIPVLINKYYHESGKDVG